MNDRYTLNQKLKRLEPTSILCQFCYQGISENMSANYFAPVYNEKDRTFAVVYSSVKYNKIEVGIPRCKKCLEIHQSSKNYGYLVGFAISLICVLVSYMIFKNNIVYLTFASIFSFVIPLILLSPLATTLIVIKRGTLTETEGAEREPVIMGMLREGWTLTQPTA